MRNETKHCYRCGKKLLRNANITSVKDGKTVYFCSLGCKWNDEDDDKKKNRNTNPSGSN